MKEMMQKLAEKEVPSASINLWHSLEQNLVKRKRNLSKQGEIYMKPRIFNRRPFQWALGVTLTVVCGFTLLFAIPQGKALAQNILQFFSRSQTEQQTVPLVDAGLQTAPEEAAVEPAQEQAAVLEEGCGSALSPACTPEKLQEAAGFPLKFPQNLKDMRFTGAAVLTNGALLQYEGSYGVLLLAQTLPGEDAAQTWTIGQGATVESVSVHNQPAEYVQGGWMGLGINDADMSWDASLPTQTLRWGLNGIEFTLVNFPAQSAGGPVGFDLAQMQQMAEEIGVPNAAENTEAEDGLTLADAKTQAGFEFNEPDWLPTGFIAYKTTYDSQHNAICRYYYTPSDLAYLSPLVIGQSTWALPGVEDLWATATYNGQEVETPVSQQFLSIQGADGGQGLFLENGLRADAFCGGEPMTANRALLWQQGTRTYALFAPLDASDGRGFVSVQEMQHLAESMTGAPTSMAAVLDPERLLSVKDAESLTGQDVRLPVVMLANVRFNHIAYRSAEEGMLVTYYAGQPVGDGRTYHILFSQTAGSQQTLDNLRLAGGYEDTIVNGNPAIYQASCWDSTTLVNESECRQFLTWFEDGTQYDLEAYFPGLVPQETIFAIAESVR